METINSNRSAPLKFIEYVKMEGIENVLIGNGFGLSHPTLRECFIWDREAIHTSIRNKPLSQCWKESSENPRCPETFLSDLRSYFVERILMVYVMKLLSDISTENMSEQKGEEINLSGLYANYVKYFECFEQKSI